jgi:hypothetical protein
MLRRTLWAGPAALVLAGSALARPKAVEPPPPPPPPAGPALIGAWRLVSAETLREGGEPSPAFGDEPSGLLIYDHGGSMALQIAGDRPSVGSIETYQALSAQDRIVFLDSYYAYFGVFEVDEAAHVVIHRVHASLRPNETGVSYRRQFTIEGERLTLASPPETHGGQTLASRLIFVRARGAA